MGRLSLFLSLGILLLAVPPARAGDEDVAPPEKKVEQKTPEDTALPKDVDAPEMSVGEEPEAAPDYQEIEAAKPAPPPRKAWQRHRPDDNIDYSRLLDTIETSDAGRGVLPPALGFRGYRPSMIAVGMDDRTPGFGGMIEYNWNRVGAGICASYRSTKGQDPKVAAYGIAGVYGLYRWLPFDMSPYFLLGLEAGSATDESTGGMLGLGIETRIYSGWTGLLGWTFHSTIHHGFLGGAIGWSF